MTLWPPVALTVPLKVPVAPANTPVPPMIVSVSVPDAGSAGFWTHWPGQAPLLKVSKAMIEPAARVIVHAVHGWGLDFRTAQVPRYAPPFADRLVR